MIYHIIISALSIVFIHSLFFDGMLLAPLRRNYLSKLPLFFQKPLYSCIVCMTSIYGVICYAAGSLFFHVGWVGLLPFLFSVGGILVLIRSVVGHAEDLFGEDYVLQTQHKEVQFKITPRIEIEKTVVDITKPKRKRKNV